MEEIQQVQEGVGREEGLRTHLSDWPPTAAAQTGVGVKKGTAELTSAAAAANGSLNSTEDRSRSPVAAAAAAEQVSAQIASQTLWESNVLESIIPSGFYSMVPSKSFKASCRTIPTLEELEQLGAEAAGSDVLLVDTHKDKTLANLEEFAKVLVNGLRGNVALAIKKIAELVSNFYGGPLFETGATKVSGDECLGSGDGCHIQLLGGVKTGLCRPRAILFKFLGDCVGIQSRLQMGLQLEAVPSSSLICANPNKHLSNIVAINGIELLVDVMRHPGYLRPFSRKALVMYHMAGAGDSDSGDYDSCDSPLTPNSPLFDFSDNLDTESLEQDVDDAHLMQARRGMISSVVTHPVHPNAVPLHPMAIGGKLSPSQSEPDLANPTRWRSQRRIHDEPSADLRNLESEPVPLRPMTEGLHSSTSSSEHPPTHLKKFQRVLSEGRMIPSCRQVGTKTHMCDTPAGTDASLIDRRNSVCSPDDPPQNPNVAGKPSPIFRRRAACSFNNRTRDNGRHGRALSFDLKTEGREVDFVQYLGDTTMLSRANFSYQAELQRPMKPSATPKITDGFRSTANDAPKQEHVGKEQDLTRARLDSEYLTTDWKLQRREIPRKSTGLDIINTEPKQGGRNQGPTVNGLRSNSGRLSGTIPQEFRNVLEGSQAGGLSDESSSVTTTTNGAASWSLTEHSHSLLNQPLMPYSEWTIDFSELRIGVRVGIGSFGEVFRGIWRGTEVAIKVMLEQDLNFENTQDFCNEISILSRLRHPNVILFLGACTKPPHLSMVTEYMHIGSLYRLIHFSGQGKGLSWRRRLKMLRDICRGMMCVQRMKIIHRDLKSANCLVDKHWSVKICDFGLSTIVMDSAVCNPTAVGTPEWTAPELLRNELVTDKCDVFSFGVIIWELATLKRPWEGVKPMEVADAVAHHGARLEIPGGLIGTLIADCWQEVPAARPSYEEILTRLHECEFLQS
ncbi:hypothetical protein CY35_07G081500 [Sphagnum magellanicum]|uniref:Uncharacterized protein n=2 Tax=Sphagnum magellanicum TaxID=128215 RepID=A0ACB8HMA5_9BRYO|nr:hypothetical protein CY35_07G081500 [Sphagnum magellanicum]KAH9557358.1 hypothetical protein CY35_07G081500 [Sphagnum magellanicum]